MISRRTPVTALLLAAIAAGFVLEVLAGGTQSPQVLVRLGANAPALVLGEGQWWRLATSLFLHAGLLHLMVNGWALYQLGAVYETWMGSARMATVYLVSGVMASLGSVYFLPTPTSVSVGASGAIFGLLGALIAFLLRRRKQLLAPARSLLLQLAGWAALNVFLGFSVANIDNAAHLTGGAIGLAVGWGMRPRWELEPPPEAPLHPRG